MSARRTLIRPTILAIVAGLAAMWIYVLFLAFGPGRQPPIDRLADPDFALAAEDICAEATAAVEELPYANEVATGVERGEVLGEADAIYAAMIDELDETTRLAPTGDQRRRATEWLADWRTLLSDRQTYAESLREDPDARLLISEKDDTGRHVTGWIDEFAQANRMPSCATPTDV